VSGALLLAEPYAGLDAGLRRSLTELADAREVPAVLAAHELAEAQAFADRLAILDHGRLLQVAAPDEVVLRPACRRVAELAGYLGFVPSDGPGPAVAGVHPERVTGGTHRERGVVLTGMVTGCRPSVAGYGSSVAGYGSSVPRGPSNPEQVGR
jgi:ABC-type Fe3+/spermidine/putrescine transport system ATPase subunit